MTGFDHRMADFGASGFDRLPDWDETYEAHEMKQRDPGVEVVDVVNRQRTMLLAVATLVASSLYMAGVFVAAIAWGNHVAAIGAVITAGVCYLSYMAQALFPRGRLGVVLVAASVVAGVLAGVSLMVW